ncbi:hypothetical protein RFI_21460 [Reticulomyxa filosa]|uniref:Uncharacterized protein n=1 Tax=Reticulomyxa filosa TaxID=46433 RepID=X6MR63_RETFI|nr:hypothetical protein RFI_21460 [Reticulomyxa filosa]|eukprot:ETO15907.1 hypothetical protein RFI_21460 [Reticulomyxa filosa]
MSKKGDHQILHGKKPPDLQDNCVKGELVDIKSIKEGDQLYVAYNRGDDSNSEQSSNKMKNKSKSKEKQSELLWYWGILYLFVYTLFVYSLFFFIKKNPTKTKSFLKGGGEKIGVVTKINHLKNGDKWRIYHDDEHPWVNLERDRDWKLLQKQHPLFDKIEWRKYKCRLKRDVDDKVTAINQEKALESDTTSPPKRNGRNNNNNNNKSEGDLKKRKGSMSRITADVW